MIQGGLVLHARAHKTDETDQEHRVNLAHAEPDDQNYVSVSDQAQVVRDRGRSASNARGRGWGVSAASRPARLSAA